MQTNGDKSETRRLGQRYTVQEASDLLGTTVDGVRSRMRRGTLDSMKVDGAVYVLLTPDQAGPVETNRTSPNQANGRSEAGPRPDELVEELRDQVSYLRERLDQERAARTEERRRHDTLMQQLMARIPELEGPRDEPQAPETPSKEPERVEEPSPAPEPHTTARRPWWLRIFGG